MPGPDAHAPFMPYGRTSAAEARASGRAGEDFREAAVLIGVEQDGRIALIERAPGGGVHGGQMALPEALWSREKPCFSAPCANGGRNWGCRLKWSHSRSRSP